MSDWKPMPGEPIYVADYADGPWYQAIFVRQGNKQFPYGTGQPGNMHYWPFARPVNGEEEPK